MNKIVNFTTLILVVLFLNSCGSSHNNDAVVVDDVKNEMPKVVIGYIPTWKDMRKTIDDTEYRRSKQIAYNKKHHLVPTALKGKFVDNPLVKSAITEFHYDLNAINKKEDLSLLPKTEIEKRIRAKRKDMEKAAKELDFIQAARLRDEIKALQALQ